jgi:hypothetical protein
MLYKDIKDGVSIINKCFVKLRTLLCDSIYMVFFQSVHVAAFIGCM